MSYFNFSVLSKAVYQCIKQDTKIFSSDKSRTRASFVNALFYDEEKYLAQSTITPWFNGDSAVSQKYKDLVNAEPDWLCSNIETFIIPVLIEPYVCSERVCSLINEDSAITDDEKSVLLSHYPCRNENDIADFLKDCYLFAINRPFVSEISVRQSAGIQLADDFSGYYCPEPCRYFTGREKEISEVHKRLSIEKHLIINGFAGIGKTEFLRKYTVTYKSEYRHILYIYCNSDLKTEIADMHFPDDKALSTDELYRQHMRRLKTLDKTLIIVDNLNSEDESLPELLRLNCDILVATRINNADYYELSELDKSELFSVFSSIYSDADKYADAVWKIISILNYHTYSVELAARLLEHTILKPSEILNQLKDKAHIKDFSDRFRTHKTSKRNTFYQHLETLFNLYQIEPETEYVLMCLAFADNNKIPVKDFAVIAGLENINIPEDLEELGLLRINEGTLEIHAVVRDFIFLKTEPDMNKMNRFTSNLTAIFKRCDIQTDSFEYAVSMTLNFIEYIKKYEDNRQVINTFLFDFFDACERYRSFSSMQKCLSYIDTSSFSNCEKAHFLDCQACISACLYSDYSTASDLSGEACNTVEKEEDLLLTANIFANAGYYQHLNNQLDSAEKYMLTAMDYFSRISDDNTVYFDKFRFIQNYCNLLGAKGEHKKAIELLEKIKAEADSKFEKENILTANILFDIGILWLIINDIQNARWNFEEAFSMYKDLGVSRSFLEEKADIIRSYCGDFMTDLFVSDYLTD